MDKQDRLFEDRKRVGNSLLTIIKEKGYTKSSFSKLVDVSRPTLDKIIKGEVDSKTTFISHMKKIIDDKIIKLDELLDCRELNNGSGVVTMYSDNAPSNHLRDESTKELFMILDDLINLSEIYQ